MSKLSYMNLRARERVHASAARGARAAREPRDLVMMLVFPAPWSPRKTSLYFASGAICGMPPAGALGAAAAAAIIEASRPPHRDDEDLALAGREAGAVSDMRSLESGRACSL